MVLHGLEMAKGMPTFRIAARLPWVMDHIAHQGIHSSSADLRASFAGMQSTHIHQHVRIRAPICHRSTLTLENPSSILQAVYIPIVYFCDWFPFRFYRRSYNWISRREKIIFWAATVLLVWVSTDFARPFGEMKRKPWSRAPRDIARLASSALLNSVITILIVFMYPVLFILDRLGIDPWS